MPCDSKMEHTTGSPTRLVKVNTHTRRVRYIYRCRYICLSAFLYVSIIILCYLQASFLSSVKGKKFPCEKWKWNARRKSCPKIDDSIGTQEAAAERRIRRSNREEAQPCWLLWQSTVNWVQKLPQRNLCVCVARIVSKVSKLISVEEEETQVAQGGEWKLWAWLSTWTFSKSLHKAKRKWATVVSCAHCQLRPLSTSVSHSLRFLCFKYLHGMRCVFVVRVCVKIFHAFCWTA